ncbi:hypothetical protein FIBSPDRAFT_903813 [Athelia psychrophila]|uniref:Ubiquitin-like protease family profile domain-containing protein n=1 Tax=Athelia psychrophila TaxID=1759441 RepID=A0A167VI06_9AGAM|nr:hypothetical protein FIBSPDRAFT_903813 [Fibularhizoctonia sp. CBS 109695]
MASVIDNVYGVPGISTIFSCNFRSSWYPALSSQPVDLSSCLDVAGINPQPIGYKLQVSSPSNAAEKAISDLNMASQPIPSVHRVSVKNVRDIDECLHHGETIPLGGPLLEQVDKTWPSSGGDISGQFRVCHAYIENVRGIDECSHHGETIPLGGPLLERVDETRLSGGGDISATAVVAATLLDFHHGHVAPAHQVSPKPSTIWSTANHWLLDLASLAGDARTISLVQTCQSQITCIPANLPLPGFTSLTPQSLALLLDYAWVDDEIIDTGAEYIMAELGEHSRAHITSCLFTSYLHSMHSQSATYNPSKTRSLDTRIHNGELDLLCFPLHVHGNHWTLLNFNIVECTFTYTDSRDPLARAPQYNVAVLRWWLETPTRRRVYSSVGEFFGAINSPIFRAWNGSFALPGLMVLARSFKQAPLVQSMNKESGNSGSPLAMDCENMFQEAVTPPNTLHSHPDSQVDSVMPNSISPLLGKHRTSITVSQPMKRHAKRSDDSDEVSFVLVSNEERLSPKKTISWDHQKRLKIVSMHHNFSPSAARLHNFCDKVLQDDHHAKFDHNNLCRRSSTVGGGAHSRTSLAAYLFSGRTWKDLLFPERQVVLCQEESEFIWRNNQSYNTFSLPGPELGKIYLKYRGVRDLVEADDGSSPWLRFAKGAIEGVYKGQETFLGLVKAVLKKNECWAAGKAPKNVQYPTAFAQLCDTLATISPHMYHTFRSNFTGPALRTLRHIRSQAPNFAPGIVAVNIDAAAKVLEDLQYHGPVTLSYDDTELEKALSVYEHSKGFLQVVGGVNVPIQVNMDDDLDKIFGDPNIIKALKHTSKVPSIVLAAVARSGKENAATLFEYHTTISQLLHACNITPLSASSDGTVTEHSLSKHIIDSHENLWRHRICGPTPDTNIDLIIPLCCCHGRVINVCQDSKHGAKTAHNQLLTGAQLLSLGHFTALYTYLRDIAVATLGPLFRRDVGNVDKQDDRAASRTLSSATIGFIGQFFPQRRGLSVYLFVLGELVDAWQNCAIKACEHVFGILRKLKKDFTLLDFLQFMPKLCVFILGEFGNLSEQEKANETAAGYHHTYFHCDDIDVKALMEWPTDGQLEDILGLAHEDVEELLSALAELSWRRWWGLRCSARRDKQ